MRKSRLLAENFFSSSGFRDHVVSAESELPAHEAFRVGTSRRSPLNYWTPGNDDADSWVQVVTNITRAADMCVIDRGHNLGGHVVRLQASHDDFETFTTLRELTVPQYSTPGTRIEDGARTNEGAVLFSFDLYPARYWRLMVPAMGTGLRPRIVGLALGLSWIPEHHFEAPWGFGDREMLREDTMSSAGWLSAGVPARRVQGDLRIRLDSPEEYDLGRYHIEEQLLMMRPAWVVMDQDWAERAWLADSARGRTGFTKRSGWGYLQGEFPVVEHEPEVL